MCFVDVQKAYGSVDRTRLWDVLARYGIPAPPMIAIIRQFRQGIRRRVHWMTAGNRSDVMPSKPPLQGCALLPLVSTRSSRRAVLDATPRHFVADAVIL